MQLSKAQLLVGERFSMSFDVDNRQSNRDLTSMRVRLVQIGALADPSAPKHFIKERIYG